MPIRIEIPKQILEHALEAAIALRERRIKAETSPIIKEALQKEITTIDKAIASIA